MMVRLRWPYFSSLWSWIPVFAGLACLPGCDDSYSESRQYPIRSDPLLTRDNRLQDEFVAPDRPGKLPLFSIRDIDDPHNPYFASREKLITLNKLIDPKTLSSEDRASLEEVLTTHFGTPAHPKVEGIDAKIAESLKLDEETLKRGSTLYRQHCLHCHGLTGDGRGPTARWVNPHPRDYRLGLFKFQSTDRIAKKGEEQKPRREDLFRTLQQGVEGTSMPAFNLLTDAQLDALVSYVIHLSLRGNLEYEALKAMWDQDAGKWTTPAGGIRGFLTRPKEKGLLEKGKLPDLAERWHSAQSPDNIIVPGPYTTTERDMEASVKRGKELFHLNSNCTACHKDYGRQVLYKFDEWGTLVTMGDLTTGVFRGGRRPIDLYWRIHSGINGSGMRTFGGNLSSDDIWDLVNFLQVLPYKGMRERYKINIH